MATSHGAALLTKNAPIALEKTRAYNIANLMQDPEEDRENTVVKKMREVTKQLDDVPPEVKKAVAEVKKLDVSKVAAAAGGGAYDEEADPLNAPEVLEAVAKFKKSLEERDVGMRKKRQEIVDGRIQEKVKELRERREKAKANTKAKVPPPPPGKDGKDSGRRGVSNLPAWMTKDAKDDKKEKKEKKRSLEVSGEQVSRKPRLEESLNQSAIRDANRLRDANQLRDLAKMTKKEILENPPSLPLNWVDEKRKNLEGYVSKKIVELLGEEESTMIQFVLTNVLEKKCSPKELIGEMTAVLDEDAEDFVLDMWQELIRIVVANAS